MEMKGEWRMVIYNENSVPGIFRKQVERHGDRACVAYKKDGQYIDVSWNEMDEMVRNLASFLISRGMEKGDRIALFSPNRYEWWVSDLAILSIGSVNVPIYATNSSEEACYVLEHSESRVCLVGGTEHLERVLEVRDRLPHLEFIVAFDQPGQEYPGVMSFADALEEGRKRGNTAGDRESRFSSIETSDLATIIYTSGTTGPPKGVMLSHGNFIANVNQVLTEFFDYVSEEDVLLSFLPLSHSLERTAGYYLPMSFGAKVAFAEDFSKIQENLLEVRPTIIVSVPRLYEKIHSGILSKTGEAPALKKVLFKWAINVAADNLPYQCRQQERKGLFALKYRVADRLIFSKLKKALGMDRLKFAVSGGGPLSPADAESFLGMGIVVLEGFGLTETTPITHVNRPWLIKPGSIGLPVKDTEAKISDQGELLIKGPQVMEGYFKDEEATRQAFTEDGFFRTGDMAVMDEEGCFRITGRIKEIIVTSGGKNISPENIECALKESRFVEQIAVVGDRRKFLSALIVPAFPEVERWAQEEGIKFENREDLVKHKRIQELFEAEIRKLTRRFARVEQIRKFRLLPHDWSQEAGELTPTLKSKRRVIEDKYSREIEEMYKE